jgi:hypothetical protein
MPIEQQHATFFRKAWSDGRGHAVMLEVRRVKADGLVFRHTGSTRPDMQRPSVTIRDLGALDMPRSGKDNRNVSPG